MGKFIDLTGQRFGRLAVIEKSKKPDGIKGNSAYWLCKCDCGSEKIIKSHSLISGNTTSCGCWQKEQLGQSVILPFGEACFNKLYATYKRSAESRGLCFHIGIKMFEELTKKNCFYCGCEPKQEMKSKNSNGTYFYNGIDRIDSSKGYTEDNVVPCCGRCNQAKMAVPQQEFLEWIMRVYNHSIAKISQ